METVSTPFGSMTRLRYQGSPIDLARGLSARPGFVFLDSSLPSPSALSILAIEPASFCRGSLFESEDVRALNVRMADMPDSGGLFGFVEFDGRFSFGDYRKIWIYRHADHQWLGTSEPETAGCPEGSAIHIGPFRPMLGREEFLAMVVRAKEYIAAGDIYQVCLSYPFEASAEGDPWMFYERLREFSPAPHAAFLRTMEGAITSASPETFLEMRGSGIVTRPIKGTRPRSADADMDAENARELKASAKENAELLMITDLERNDLGRVCRYGSVRVSALNALEHFRQVHHLISTVEGQLREGVSHADALCACFPGGSISGAPKHRALEIIAELEAYPRGLYTGAIGYFGAGNESAFNIAIRTAEFGKGRVRFYSGGGIVADSDPVAEWEETVVKARSILGAAGQDA